MEIEFPKRDRRCSAASPRRPPSRSSSRRCARPSARTSTASSASASAKSSTATVKRFESGDIIVEVGRIEAQIPRKEQSRAENYAHGDRVRAVIKAVSRTPRARRSSSSRTDPALLIKLFEQEVPEIYDGTVMIRGAVREAGDRAKVAVYSRERDVDPVGACVGMKRHARAGRSSANCAARRSTSSSGSEDPVTLRDQGPEPGQGAARDHRGRRAARHGSGGRGSSSCRWPSARRARTSASPPS